MRILFAEDEIELASALEVIFKHNNYAVDVVYNGVDATDYALANDYDVIILDIMMPKRDGITALKMIREQNNKTPVLLLTAKSQIADKVTGLDSGADDYLVKPFSTVELLARIRALTRRSESQGATNELTLGNIKVDLTNYLLKGPLGELPLINKEFQLLVEFLKNPKRYHPASELLDKIWGIESDVYEDIVWVNLSYLRKKLKNVGSNVFIKVSRNQGYYLEVNNDQ